MSSRGSALVANVVGASALAYMLSYVKIPYPPLPYLVFDLGEVPVLTLFLVGSAWAGLASALVYAMALMVTGQFVPIGPVMKLLALLSTMAGLAPLRAGAGRRVLAASLLLSTASRVLVMTLANYVVLTVLFPGFLEAAARSLTTYLGGWAGGDPLALVLLFTAFFNVAHVLVSVAPSVSVARLLGRWR